MRARRKRTVRARKNSPALFGLPIEGSKTALSRVTSPSQTLKGERVRRTRSPSGERIQHHRARDLDVSAEGWGCWTKHDCGALTRNVGPRNGRGAGMAWGNKRWKRIVKRPGWDSLAQCIICALPRAPIHRDLQPHSHPLSHLLLKPIAFSMATGSTDATSCIQ